MRYVDEYRDAEIAEKYSREINSLTTKPWTIMEVCGGQTHTIVKYGIDDLLPDTMELLHGPGCPVCVTPTEFIDKAIDIASQPDVIFCSFGDMLRVPGTKQDLLSVKANGGDVRIVYSPLDALTIAVGNPDKHVVFFAVGFETTAPANAMVAYQARKDGIRNITLLVSQVLIPPAINAILNSPDMRVQGFLAPGHVCTVMGYSEYEPIVEKHNIPIVVTGFEPLDILQGILMCVRQLEDGRAEVENQYTRSVTRDGNRRAMEIMKKVFRVVSRKWRGIGEIAQSGLALAEEYSRFDAEELYGKVEFADTEPSECISGLVLQGVKAPRDCPAFGTRCTPEHPLGATMVSSEGACAAYYRYRGGDALSESPQAKENC
jgi:hydrogenase expression/formation protein HypD